MNTLEVLKSGIEGFGLEASDKKLQNLKKYCRYSLTVL